jgi:hypothetical protein
MISSVYRMDPTNIGDWFAAPRRYFRFDDEQVDIIHMEPEKLSGLALVGGGGLIAETFLPQMARLAAARSSLKGLVAWGLGESLIVDRSGAPVSPYTGAMPDLLRRFDLVGVRDFGTEYPWVPCVSCMMKQFDRPLAAPKHEIVLYEHKRIPIPIDGFPRITNAAGDIDEVLNFLASGEVVITNSYHGAYWATLLGRRVLAIPSMSKIYRLRHAPLICRAERWKSCIDLTVSYPAALNECRAATLAFHKRVEAYRRSIV